ncbi:MAG: hypothetical protein CVV64_04150 [Candidatus Wallbacteria bacterium HGW-Wallbacteria-1]|uniref:AMMECR1 domain-containing protein n=1 Tax=Candidatus Wallbacteria bacterium HGW-Wallbacteria-1 TaxID=2013854 RepID=A0A2N1PTF1_9BACT|nr:MAG: hypothetical protein CVV64_04150 [Candidatus Wallbacteria bacterium HGW-Wallbacteria-1]
MDKEHNSGTSLKKEVSSHFIGEPIGKDTETELLSLARKSITSAVREGKKIQLPNLSGEMALHRGAFVTLTRHGQLRGCIGRIAGDTPLGQVVAEYAVLSALEDNRFSPVRTNELDSIKISISVMSPMKEISGPEEFKVGIHGILIQKNGRQAIFLPQVAPEQGWDRDTTLDHLCLKAWLPEKAWKEPDCKFFIYTAQIFGEE